MSIIPFVFVNGWDIISHKGDVLTITEEDLINYAENDLSISEIKSMAYSYLTSTPFTDLSIPFFYTHEF